MINNYNATYNTTGESDWYRFKKIKNKLYLNVNISLDV